MYMKFLCLGISALLLTSCCTTSDGRRAGVSQDGSASGGQLMLNLNAKQSRMKEVIDDNVNLNGPDERERFPDVLRPWIILTMDLTLNDLLSDSADTTKPRGKKIGAVARAMRDNLIAYRQLPAAYHTRIPLAGMQAALNRAVAGLNSTHEATHFRDFYTKNLRQDTANYGEVFGGFDDIRNLPNGQIPFLAIDTDIERTDANWALTNPNTDGVLPLDLVGSYTYFSLFTIGKDDVSQEVHDAASQLVEKKVIWAKGNEAGVDCCCPNVDPATGKKRCWPTPDIGCTNTGTPPRCTLGSYYCPTNCAY